MQFALELMTAFAVLVNTRPAKQLKVFFITVGTPLTFIGAGNAGRFRVFLYS